METQTTVETKDAIEIRTNPTPGTKVLTLEEQLAANKAQADKEAARNKHLAEVEKENSLKAQDNVQDVDESNVHTTGKDFFTRLFSEYYGCEFPGFDSLFTDERFPKKDGGPIAVSRCYHYKVEGKKYLLFDILDREEGEESQAAQDKEILENKSVFNGLGFLYTWVFKGEKVNLKQIFEERLNAEVKKYIPKPMKQTNVDFNREKAV